MKAKKILVVDDEDAVRSMLATTVMDESQYALLEAANGSEALSLASREKPDIMLLDVVMPGLDGFEVCRRLKSDPSTRDILVIIITALAGHAQAEKAREAGADVFISKPFSPIALIRRIESLLAAQHQPRTP